MYKEWGEFNIIISGSKNKPSEVLKCHILLSECQKTSFCSLHNDITKTPKSASKCSHPSPVRRNLKDPQRKLKLSLQNLLWNLKIKQEDVFQTLKGLIYTARELVLILKGNEGLLILLPQPGKKQCVSSKGTSLPNSTFISECVEDLSDILFHCLVYSLSLSFLLLLLFWEHRWCSLSTHPSSFFSLSLIFLNFPFPTFILYPFHGTFIAFSFSPLSTSLLFLCMFCTFPKVTPWKWIYLLWFLVITELIVWILLLILK